MEDGSADIRLLVRSAGKLESAVREKTTVFEGNTLEPETLDAALSGVDTAYYLIHSMGAKGDYAALDRKSAEIFRDACIKNGVRRIVYLGGLGQKETASKHLLSRLETGEILSARPDDIQTIWFRAGIIIGSGSASFEIIRHLVHKLPVMITPRFVRTRTQPISVTDVIDYLSRAKNLETSDNAVVDIGADVMTFKDMLLQTAKVMGLKRRLIPVPIFTPTLSSYWLVLITPVPFGIAGALVKGLKSETVAQNDLAARLFPDVRPMPYQSAVRTALEEMKREQVISAWCDSSAQSSCDIEGRAKIAEAVVTDSRTFPYDGHTPEDVFAAVARIGGETGWYGYDRLWRFRGLMDKVIGGPGLRRGRRHPTELRLGDSLDFWKVVDIQPGKRLLLANQMIVPGEAWLEFQIEPASLTVTAHFLPRGLWGRLYWLLTKPFHTLIFSSMGKNILKQAKALLIN